MCVPFIFLIKFISFSSHAYRNKVEINYRRNSLFAFVKVSLLKKLYLLRYFYVIVDIATKQVFYEVKYLAILNSGGKH